MAGAVAVILQMPSDIHGQYRVRFPDGAETCLRRTDFQVRKHLAKRIGTALGTSEADLYQFVIYRCIVGVPYSRVVRSNQVPAIEIFFGSIGA